MPALEAASPLQYVKGVGPVRAEWFAEAGLRTVGDLLEYYPFRYELDTGAANIADLNPGTTATVLGTVVRVRRAGGASWIAEVYDGTESCLLRWFHQPHTARGLYVGATVVATGAVREYNDRYELVQPRVQVFPPDALIVPQQRGQRRVGVYRAAGQLTSALVRRAVQAVLEQPHLPIQEFLPSDLLRRHELPQRAAAIRAMHSPRDEAELQRARARLAYEEFLLLEIALAIRRHRRMVRETGQKLRVTPEVDRRIRARFPFDLTPSQDAVIRDIAADLESGRPMTRLLQGDVGSGKTVVALYACLAAIANRRQAALMAPTEILAQQHFNNIARYLAGSRVRYVSLRGGLPASARRQMLAGIQRGEIDLVVGTQALIQKDVSFKDLALVVVDEQHKFGVLQRAAFRTKGPLPHYLVMTATPIPRTLAMTVFGDLDVSVIRHGPPGRGKVTTRVVVAGQWGTVMADLRRRLEAGEQAYVVCPRIGEQVAADPRVGRPVEAPAAATPVASLARRELPAQAGVGRHPDGTSSVGSGRPPCRPSESALLSVHEVHRRLMSGPWCGLEVGLLHGGLRTAEKDRIVAAFAAGRLRALVATTVVEVGVDVPSATIMVVEHAERFGLSQLHQLRGRVGRGAADAWCVLIARGGGSARAADRLAIMSQTTDGFRIAEADLRQRGPGELLGTRQHGLPELRVGDLVGDFELLQKARDDAFDLVRRDPTLSQPEHGALRAALKRAFGRRLGLIDAA